MEVTLDYMARRAANKFPDHTALIFEDQYLTYADFDERFNRMANGLLALGLAKGDRVGVLMGNCPEYMDCIFGIARAGGVFLPLNNRFKAKELAYVLNKSEAKFLIYEEEFQESIEQLKQMTRVEKYICAGQSDNLDYHQELQCASAAEVPCRVSGPDTAMIMFSSGTTGNPKGVCAAHQGLVWNCVNLKHNYDWNGEDILFTPTPMFHVGALSRAFVACYVGAAQLVTRQFKPEPYLQLLEKEKVTITALVATMFTMVRLLPNADQYDVSAVREITLGAAPTPLALLKKVCAFFPNAKVWNAYGLTEHPSAAAMRVDQFPPKMNSVGKPFLNVEIKIVDDQKRPLPAGEVGEICLRGPVVMQGYFADEKATREALHGDWLHTGDLGRMDEEGYLYIADRIKDMIISGGENIYSKEIEDVLYQHEGVADAAVIGVEDELWGETVRAIIQPRPGAQLTEEEIVAFCAERLAGYKKPKSVIFVDEMPKTATNKILKRELREKYGRS